MSSASRNRKRALTPAPLALRAAGGAIAILALFTAPARAALDAEAKKPYQLDIVLHIADNRALTPLFQDELQRTLIDQLRQSFGALAEVKVVRTHPLLPEIAARGLEQMLDGWEQAESRQTHFVLLDYRGGQYRLQARMHDGMTGMAGALVRRVETGDRALVPVLAAKLVEDSFAPVGTVTATKPAGKGVLDVQLTLKGGNLGVPLGRWVKPGEVFAVSQVVSQGERQRPRRMAWALLEVVGFPEKGVCRCRYWRRFLEDDLRDAPGVSGYRALKLATSHEPVRLRVLDDETLLPIDGTQVQVTRPGTKDKEAVTTRRDGLAVTREAFAHFVIVSLPSEGVRFPLELIEGRTAVCRIKVKGGSETLAALEARCDAWLRRVYDDLSISAERTRELGQRVGQSLPGAAKLAGEGLANLNDELKQLSGEYSELKQLALDHKLSAGRFDLADGKQRLDELYKKRDKLSEFIARVEKAIKEGEENAILSQQLERARLLEAEADFEQAIRVYENVVKARPNETKVREHLEQLRKGWALAGEKHQAARVFVYGTWAGTLNTAGLKQNLDAARQALATLKAAGDRLTAEKMRQADVVHTAYLKKERDRLKLNDTPDNRNRAKVLAEVATGLGQLHAEIIAFIGASQE
jgi:tetratricopeptide (TPR) repeat protein